MAGVLKSLMRQRVSVKAQVTCLINALRESTAIFKVHEIKGWLVKLEEHYHKFFLVQERIEAFEDRVDFEAAEDFETSYYECSDLLNVRLEEATSFNFRIMAEELKSLMRQRVSVKAQVTCLINALRESTAIFKVHEIKGWLVKLEEHYHKFFLVQERIEAFEDRVDFEAAEDFETSYYECCDLLNELLRKENSRIQIHADTELRERYNEFLAEYESLGHVIEVEESDNTECYLPHHAVIKDNSPTTKVRAVIDASAKTDTGVSQNDVLMVGPTIQDDVFSLIDRFRNYEFGITADQEKMFRQILVHRENNSIQTTKGSILSKIAQLFDPLDLLAPVIVKAKTMMQTLWKPKLGWDDLVPSDIQTLWNTYRQQLTMLNEFSIAREIIIKDYSDVQLHGFCDASETAHGACIYLRSSDANNRVKVNLIAAKSRIAPLKTISIPRLELCAALVLAELYRTVSKSLDMQFNAVNFWSDSTITLHWIRTAPNTLKTFVANRFAKIQEATNDYNWRHIISSGNPADGLSRGQLPGDFLANRLWLKGPTWLSEPSTNWPSVPSPNIDVPEQRPIVSSASTITNSDFLNRFSSWTTLQRVIAYGVRFCKNAARSEQNTGPLSISELNRAHNYIIKNVQGRHFAREYSNLKHGVSVHNASKILALTPFIDNGGIIHVGSRLKNSDIRYNRKHPILLPRSDHITRLTIEYKHKGQSHAGVLGTLYAIRQRYWPIDGKGSTRHIIRRCIRCFKVNPLSVSEYSMGNLPRDRVVATRPFQTTGVDFCSPSFIKKWKHRNTKKIKIYVALFICFVTKAIHLELMSELSTEAFIATLKGFFSRRGYASTIYSDNATNFVGTKTRLQEEQAFLRSEQQKNTISNYLIVKNISWHFSPLRSPHFGGLWEAAVKPFKHMRRTIGEALFSFGEFSTYIIEIEAILNSRLLTPLSSNPNDLSALTPAQSLTGEPLTNIPERDVPVIATNRLSVWEHIKKLRQHFWTRCYKEYWNELKHPQQMAQQPCHASPHWLVDTSEGGQSTTYAVEAKTCSGNSPWRGQHYSRTHCKNREWNLETKRAFSISAATRVPQLGNI